MERLYLSIVSGHHPFDSLTLPEFSAIPDELAETMFDRKSIEGLQFKAKVLCIRRQYRRDLGII